MVYKTFYKKSKRLARTCTWCVGFLVKTYVKHFQLLIESCTEICDSLWKVFAKKVDSVMLSSSSFFNAFIVNQKTFS